MHFVIHCLDRPGAAPVRAAHYEAHKAYLAGALPVHILVSGPLVDGADPVGSFFLIEAPGPEAVATFRADDPFTAAGIWHQVNVHAFLKRQDNR